MSLQLTTAARLLFQRAIPSPLHRALGNLINSLWKLEPHALTLDSVKIEVTNISNPLTSDLFQWMSDAIISQKILLVQKSYSSISSQKCQILLGLADDAFKQTIVSLGWRCDNGLIFPNKATADCTFKKEMNPMEHIGQLADLTVFLQN